RHSLSDLVRQLLYPARRLRARKGTFTEGFGGLSDLGRQKHGRLRPEQCGNSETERQTDEKSIHSASAGRRSYQHGKEIEFRVPWRPKKRESTRPRSFWRNSERTRATWRSSSLDIERTRNPWTMNGGPSSENGSVSRRRVRPASSPLRARPRLRRRLARPLKNRFPRKPSGSPFEEGRCGSLRTWRRASPFRPRHRNGKSRSSCWMRTG